MIRELLNQWHITGLAVGLATFLIIGLFHPIVIKGEYYFGLRMRWFFFILGIIMCALSVLASDYVISILAGVTAFSSFWGIKEVNEQRERVLKGWFPMNPRRADEYAADKEPKD